MTLSAPSMSPFGNGVPCTQTCVVPTPRFCVPLSPPGAPCDACVHSVSPHFFSENFHLLGVLNKIRHPFFSLVQGMGVAPFGFCMFIFWEIIPTTMILLQFQKICFPFSHSLSHISVSMVCAKENVGSHGMRMQCVSPGGAPVVWERTFPIHQTGADCWMSLMTVFHACRLERPTRNSPLVCGSVVLVIPLLCSVFWRGDTVGPKKRNHIPTLPSCSSSSLCEEESSVQGPQSLRL